MGEYMNKKALSISILSCILGATAVHAGPMFDADLEINTDAVNTKTGDTTFDQNGRVALNASSKHTSGDNFIYAKGTVLISTDGDTSVDDSYIQLGNSTYNFQLGRFEANNLFPAGKDTMVEHAGGVSVYTANMARGRAGSDGGQLAFNMSVSDNLAFQLGTIYGDDDSNGDDTTAVSGVRPVITYTADSFTLSAGFEQVKYDGVSDVNKSGLAVTANFDIGDANVNVSVANMKNKQTDQKVRSYSANLTQGNFGIGFIASEEDNVASIDPSVMTTYVAYSMPLFDIDGATVTLAGSYSVADDVAVGTNDETIATRVRLNYAF